MRLARTAQSQNQVQPTRPVGRDGENCVVSSGIDVSLVIPTYNERENVRVLHKELAAALVGVSWEALFVDDSDDGTDAVVRSIEVSDPRVRVLHREVNTGGLAGAVVDGLLDVRGTYVCVLDADLQHPPERIPEMLGVARRTNADVVVASRYMPGGSTGGLDGPLRQLYSVGLKTLSQTLFPRRLATVSDPLDGFFLLNRSILNGVQLRPLGYKILLEILVRCQWGSASEIPYSFQPRRHGDSKADFRQGMCFLRHLGMLFVDCSPVFAPARLVRRVDLGRDVAALTSRS